MQLPDEVDYHMMGKFCWQPTEFSSESEMLASKQRKEAIEHARAESNRQYYLEKQSYKESHPQHKKVHVNTTIDPNDPYYARFRWGDDDIVMEPKNYTEQEQEDRYHYEYKKIMGLAKYGIDGGPLPEKPLSMKNREAERDRQWLASLPRYPPNAFHPKQK